MPYSKILYDILYKYLHPGSVHFCTIASTMSWDSFESKQHITNDIFEETTLFYNENIVDI